MNHTQIDQEQIAERYVLGQLSGEEAARFEEHSLSCDRCLDRLEAAEGLRRGLATVAAQKAQETITRAVGFGLLARWAHSRYAPVALTLLLVAALVPTGVLWMQLEEAEREIARVEAAHAETTDAPADAATEGAGNELAALQERLAAVQRERDAQNERLEGADAELRRLEGELERAARPQPRRPAVNVPLLTLEPERSVPGGEPSARLALADGTELVLLSLDVAGRDFASFGLILRGPRGESLWQASGLVPDETGFLNVAVPTGLLGAGAHRLELTGADGDQVLGRFPFRVSP